MSTSPAKLGHRFSWTDYQTWPDHERWEIIGGEAYDMSPSPGSRHQSISVALSARLYPAFEKGPCRLFAAPIDVKLSDQDVVQPDLIVVCDRKQIQETHIEGPPALAVEILSPSSLRHDRVRKRELYGRSGVKEFWIVTPEPPLVEVFLLDGTSYRLRGGYGPDETLRSPRFPRLKMSLDGVFDFPGVPAHGKQVKEAPPPYGTRTRTRGPARFRRP